MENSPNLQAMVDNAGVAGKAVMHTMSQAMIDPSKVSQAHPVLLKVRLWSSG